MPESVNEIAAKFKKEGLKTIEFIKSIPEDVLDTQLYDDGDQWTIRKTCIHLVEAEGSIPKLIKNILDGREGVPIDFDLDRYNASMVKKLGELSQEEIVSRMTELRAETVKMISELNEDDLGKTGRHPFMGESNIRDMLRIMLINASSHIR
ncbi:MAG: DinB family protein, partial [Chloroflexota bacterium]